MEFATIASFLRGWWPHWLMLVRSQPQSWLLYGGFVFVALRSLASYGR